LIICCDFCSRLCVDSVIEDHKLTAGTQTEPMPTRIDRMPLDVPAADTRSAAATSPVLALHSAADLSATEVALLVFGLYCKCRCCLPSVIICTRDQVKMYLLRDINYMRHHIIVIFNSDGQ